MVNWLSDPANSFSGMLTSYPAWNLRSKPSTGLTGVAVQGISLRFSCASRIAASDVKSRTTPLGPEAGIRVWAETAELKTSEQARNSALPTHPRSFANLGTIAMALSTCDTSVPRLHPGSLDKVLWRIFRKAQGTKDVSCIKSTV